MRIITRVLIFIGLAILPVHVGASFEVSQPTSARKTTKPSTSDRLLARALKRGLSEFTVQCSGTVTRILLDDIEGIRHQRFIIKLASGQTLLIVHNIYLTPRIARLKLRDRIVVKGEYIWSHQGGLIHLTHRDPYESGIDGFIRHKGITYQ